MPTIRKVVSQVLCALGASMYFLIPLADGNESLACLAQQVIPAKIAADNERQATPAKINKANVDQPAAPRRLIVYAPTMSKKERDALILQYTLITAVVFAVIIALIVWRTLPSKQEDGNSEEAENSKIPEDASVGAGSSSGEET